MNLGKYKFVIDGEMIILCIYRVVTTSGFGVGVFANESSVQDFKARLLSVHKDMLKQILMIKEKPCKFGYVCSTHYSYGLRSRYFNAFGMKPLNTDVELMGFALAALELINEHNKNIDSPQFEPVNTPGNLMKFYYKTNEAHVVFRDYKVSKTKSKPEPELNNW